MPQLQLAVLLAVLFTAALAMVGCRPYWDEFESLLRRFVALILFVAILTLAVFLPVASYGQIAQLSVSDLDLMTLLGGHVVLSVFLIVWWLLRSKGSLAEFLHLSSRNLGSKVVHGIVTGCNGWLLTILVMFVVITLVGQSTGQTADPSQVPDVMPWMAKLALREKLIIVLVAMTVEEAFFRGFLQARLGLVASSILFALGHFSYGMPFMIVGVFTISLAIGHAFAVEGDLLPCILAHGVFDSIQIFVVLPLAVEMLERSQAIAS